MVDINKLQGSRELIHVIKQLEIYLTHHKSENNKVNHIKGNPVCKNKCKCLAPIRNDLSTFILFHIFLPLTKIITF